MAIVVPPWLSQQGQDLILEVLVNPESAKTRIMGVSADRLMLQLEAPDADGKANDVLVKHLADLLEVATAQIEVIGGQSNPRKTVCLAQVGMQHAVLRLSPPRA